MRSRILWNVFLFVCILSISACNLPESRPPAATYGPDAVYTAAVQTVIAQLTLSAAQATPQPAPTQAAVTSPAEAPSATLPNPETQPPGGPTLTVPAATQPTPTATAPPAPATPKPTLAASDPRASLGEPTWRDSFENGANWSLSSDTRSSMEVKDGKLVMIAYKADSLDWWSLTWPKVDNFYVEATGTFGDCAGRDRYGVILRAPSQADRGVLFALSCDGQYSFWIMDTKIPKKTVLVDWTASPRIQPDAGATNRLGVKAEGDQLSLYANGSLLADVRDSTLDGSFFGVFIGAARTAGFRVDLDEIAYWELP